MTHKSSQFSIQNLALLPVSTSYQSEELKNVLRHHAQEVIERLYQCIRQNHLGPLWIEAIGSNAVKEIWGENLGGQLNIHYRHCAFLYFQQLAVLRNLTELLDHHGIPHAVFKGVHTREFVYTHPISRYSCDIDILIADSDKHEVIALLTENGFTLHKDKDNLTHEVSLKMNNVCIDLHWHIMRPGRIASDHTRSFLAGRQRQQDYWSLNTVDNLFIQLVHHVFTKYPTITQGGLIRMVDLALWIRNAEIDWDALFYKLKHSEVCSAAWISCTYLELLSGVSFPDEFTAKISPSSTVKRWYLEQWMTRDLPSRFKDSPIIPKIFFTLMAHDSLSRALSFYAAMRKSKVSVEKMDTEMTINSWK